VKKHIHIILILIALLLVAQVVAQPINYQGRLSDKSGTNVNGTKNFDLRIFDAKTGGKQIYEENVGAVTVNEGAYSFNFGENGKSVSTATETIGYADGEKQIFNYTVKNPPILGEISISGGGYSWTESGSSDATKFTATANKNSGAVSAIFLTGAPEAGENVSISYDHNSNGVMGALSRGGQAWLELVVGGETLSLRERLVAVPFALKALESVSARKHPESLLYRDSTGKSYEGSGPGHNVDVWNTHRSISVYIPKGTKYVSVIAGDLEYKFKHNGYSNGQIKTEWRARIGGTISKSIVQSGNYNEVVKFKTVFNVNSPVEGIQEFIIEYKETDSSSIPVKDGYKRLRSWVSESAGSLFIHAHFE
jgi:hypothetical protein